MASENASRMVPRLVPTSPESEMVALWAMLYSIPVSKVLESVNAFAIFGGMGETWCVRHAIEVFHCEANDYNSVLLVAGTRDDERTYDRLTPARLEQPPYKLYPWFAYNRIVFVQDDIPKNTIDQCAWVAKMVGEFKLDSVALFASPHHLVRAWSTLLKTFMKRGIRIPIIPVPTQVPPAALVPEDGQDVWAHVAGEIERIKKYREKGDVATFEEAKEFINWMWREWPPLASSNLGVGS